jgi:16S rRNA processing protein RimM
LLFPGRRIHLGATILTYATGGSRPRIYFHPGMDQEKLHRLGRLGKPWGHRGELALMLEEADFAGIQDFGVLFVELDGQHVPFFLTHLRQHPRVGALVKFEDFDDPDSVAFLVNAEVFAPPGHKLDVGEEEDDFLDPAEFIGMTVLDEEHGKLGVITGTEGSEDNPVMVVEQDGREILIPMVDDIIIGIDLETGHLVVRTPPGLVDLYRGA